MRRAVLRCSLEFHELGLRHVEGLAVMDAEQMAFPE